MNGSQPGERRSGQPASFGGEAVHAVRAQFAGAYLTLQFAWSVLDVVLDELADLRP